MSKGAGLFYIAIWALALSCKQDSSQTSSFFDSLVVDQAGRLARAKATLKKVSSFDGKEEKITSTPGARDWENELSIFRQLSAFERPAYHSVYRLDDGLKDAASNLVIRRYQTSQDVPVPELRFYYFQQFEHLKKIEAVYQQRNLLYSTTRRLVMEFEDVGGRPILSAYHIAGLQKMIMTDSVKFTVRSEITN